MCAASPPAVPAPLHPRFPPAFLSPSSSPPRPSGTAATWQWARRGAAPLSKHYLICTLTPPSRSFLKPATADRHCRYVALGPDGGGAVQPGHVAPPTHFVSHACEYWRVHTRGRRWVGWVGVGGEGMPGTAHGGAVQPGHVVPPTHFVSHACGSWRVHGYWVARVVLGRMRPQPTSSATQQAHSSLPNKHEGQTLYRRGDIY